MTHWLVGALVLVVAIAPLGVVCFLRDPMDGLVALQAAGVTAALALLCLAEGFDRQPFADLALVAAAMSFAGTLAFVYFLERRL